MDSKKLFQSMVIVFYSIMVGHLLFASVVVFILKPMPNDLIDINMFMSVAAAVSVIAVMFGYWWYQQQVQKIRDEGGEETLRLTNWRSPFILRLAMIDAACFLNIIFLLLTGGSIFLYLYVGTAVAMLYCKPRHLRVAEELGLEKLW